MMFGSRLKDLRKKKGMTQQGLAIKSGIHWRTISRLESTPDAKKNPYFYLKTIIDNGYDVTPQEIMRMRAVLDAWGKLKDDDETPEVWAKSFKTFNPKMPVSPEMAVVFRDELLGRVDRFVRSLE